MRLLLRQMPDVQVLWSLTDGLSRLYESATIENLFSNETCLYNAIPGIDCALIRVISERDSFRTRKMFNSSTDRSFIKFL
jgi:hypothetical protein